MEEPMTTIPTPRRPRGTARAILALAAAAAFTGLGSDGVTAQTTLLDLDRADASPVVDALDDGGFAVQGQFGVGAIPVTGQGTRLMWYPGKAAFRAGRIDGQGPTFWDDAEVGNYSTAFGIVPRASAPYAFAAGYLVAATNDGATALGFSSLASGFTSLAAGYQSQATGHSSVAMGREAVASAAYSYSFGYKSQATGVYAIAIGYNTLASGSSSAAFGSSAIAAGQSAFAQGPYIDVQGDFSSAMGSHVTVPSAHFGSHTFGDRNWSANTTLTTAPHQFAARATGGVRFYTNPTLTTGVTLAAGGSSWASLSDVNAKENFRALDGEYVLDAIDDMSIREWNYRENDDDIRHIGPTAQEFHAAFGLGSDPLRIETIDADGVALAAIQALIRRNRMLAAENRSLQARVDALAADGEARDDRLAELESRLDALAALLEQGVVPRVDRPGADGR
jgi:hypothetical protein